MGVEDFFKKWTLWNTIWLWIWWCSRLKCKLKSEEELKKKGHGSYDGSVDLNSGIVIVRWLDNKAVQLISNYNGIEPIDEVERWSKSAGKMITVSRPKIVKVYNSAIGGVNLFNMFQALYRLDHKSHRWYMRIFYWILASSVINAWLRYHKDFDSMKLSKGNESFLGKQKRMSLIEFTMNVSSSLLKNAKPVTVRKSGWPSSFMEESTTSKEPTKAPDLKEVPADKK